VQREHDLRLDPRALAAHLPLESAVDPDVLMIAKSWAELPEAIRAGIAAMVRAALPPASLPTAPRSKPRTSLTLTTYQTPESFLDYPERSHDRIL
jgi:hypothetical protein